MFGLYWTVGLGAFLLLNLCNGREGLIETDNLFGLYWTAGLGGLECFQSLVFLWISEGTYDGINFTKQGREDPKNINQLCR